MDSHDKTLEEVIKELRNTKNDPNLVMACNSFSEANNWGLAPIKPKIVCLDPNGTFKVTVDVDKGD